MSPNDAHWSVGTAHRQTAEAPVFPGRGFSASVARLSPRTSVWRIAPCGHYNTRSNTCGSGGRQWRSIAMPREFSRRCGWPEGALFPDQTHGFLMMGKIIAGSSLRRSRNVDLSRTGLVRLVVYRGMDCSVIPDIAAIHTGRVERQRQSTGAVDRDKPAQPANRS
jgi:hypothetical protein